MGKTGRAIERMVKRILKSLTARTPLPGLVLRKRAAHHVTVLAYHRICEVPGPDYPFDPELISATPEEFHKEIRYVQQHLDVISVEELAAGILEGKALPARPAVVTFDDGYRDNAECAMPILREHGIPGCFFLASRLVGTSAVPWWDQIACCFRFASVAEFPSPFGAEDAPYSTDAALRKASIRRFLRRIKSVSWSQALDAVAHLREVTRVEPEAYAPEPLFMDWDAARGLCQAGMSLGGHTRTHPIVAQLDDDRMLRDEIQGCYDDIRQHTGTSPVAFAYPVGSLEAMSERGDAAIAAAGFRLSFSYLHGLAGCAAGGIRIPRVHSEFGQDYVSFLLGLALAPSLSGPAGAPSAV